MKVAGIIAEYNPFHNGHKYQIDTIRALGYDYIVALMSSSFVQRGEPAIFDKWTRTKAALLNGVDLVLELPVPYCASTAQIFAQGAVHILTETNLITDLFFGAENALEELLDVQEKMSSMDSSTLKQSLRSGMSFIQARERALAKQLTPSQLQLLRQPNNILALEYLHALRCHEDKINSIRPHALPRKDVHHHERHPHGAFASATAIRHKIHEGQNYADYVPHNVLNLYQQSTAASVKDLYLLFRYQLMNSAHLLSHYLDYEEGLERRFLRCLSCHSYEQFLAEISTKRYSTSRLQRLLLAHLLDLDKTSIRECLSSTRSTYLRVLGIELHATPLLRQLPPSTILRFRKDTENIPSILSWTVNKEVLSTNLRAAIARQAFNADYTTPLVRYDAARGLFVGE